jgi:hypothetical protein
MAHRPISLGIDTIDTKKPVFLFEIPLASGPNGVLVFHRGSSDFLRGTLVAAGTDSKIYLIAPANPFAPPIAVSTGGTMRADELV